MVGYAVVTNSTKISGIIYLSLTSFLYYISFVDHCVCVYGWRDGEGVERSFDLHSHSGTQTDEDFSDLYHCHLNILFKDSLQ